MQPATKKDDIDIFRMNVNFQKCGVDLTDQFDDLNPEGLKYAWENIDICKEFKYIKIHNNICVDYTLHLNMPLISDREMYIRRERKKIGD